MGRRAGCRGRLTVIGSVHGRRVMVVANDATVKAGACFPMTIKKILRAQTIAADNRLPLVYLVDSSGVFLPMQDEVFPDEDDFGRIFRNNAVLSAQGIPQYRGDHGQLRGRRGVSAGALRHGADDRRLGPLSRGPRAGEGGDRPGASRSEELGGAPSSRGHQRHHRLPGTRRRRLPGPAAPADRHASRRSRSRDRSLWTRSSAPACGRRLPRSYRASPRPSTMCATCWTACSTAVHSTSTGPSTVRRSSADSAGSAASRWGSSPISGCACVAEGGGPFQFGGVIYADSADKAARFVLECNQSRLPLLFIQDVNGFDVGRDAERSGIIRRGAKLVNAVSNSAVPKITLIVGHSFGAGHYALCGKAFDPRFLFAWPGAATP